MFAGFVLSDQMLDEVVISIPFVLRTVAHRVVGRLDDAVVV